MALSCIDTFREILSRYDHCKASRRMLIRISLNPRTKSADVQLHHGSRLMMEHLAVDPAQEEYWNTSDDEDDLVSKISKQVQRQMAPRNHWSSTTPTRRRRRMEMESCFRSF